jgi:hypothetical protein
MLRVLKPGSSASLVIFGAGGARDSEVAETIVRRRVGAAPVPVRGSWATLAPPGALKQRLEAAGFQNVQSHDLLVPFRLPSAADALAYIRDLHPTLTELLAPLTADEREAVWREVEGALESSVDANGYESPSRVVVAAGTRPIVS